MPENTMKDVTEYTAPEEAAQQQQAQPGTMGPRLEQSMGQQMGTPALEFVPPAPAQSYAPVAQLTPPPQGFSTGASPGGVLMPPMPQQQQQLQRRRR